MLMGHSCVKVAGGQHCTDVQLPCTVVAFLLWKAVHGMPTTDMQGCTGPYVYQSSWSRSQAVRCLSASPLLVAAVLENRLEGDAHCATVRVVARQCLLGPHLVHVCLLHASLLLASVAHQVGQGRACGQAQQPGVEGQCSCM